MKNKSKEALIKFLARQHALRAGRIVKAANAARSKRLAAVRNQDYQLKANARRWLVSQGIPNPTTAEIFDQVYGSEKPAYSKSTRTSEAEILARRAAAKERLRIVMEAMGCTEIKKSTGKSKNQT